MACGGCRDARYDLSRRMTETGRHPSPEEELLEQLMEECDRVTKRSEVLHALQDEWIVATRLVSVYKNLFSDAERLEVLNLIAGPLLRLTQDVLWDYLLLRVARLTDPPTAGRKREKESLSVLWLPSLFGGDKDEDQQKAKLQLLVAEANEAASFARKWRNQVVAHVDLERARDDVTHFFRDNRPPVAEPLEPPTLEAMDRALEAVHRALDTALRYHYGSEKGMSLKTADVSLDIGAAVFDRGTRLVQAVQLIDTLVHTCAETPLPGEVETASEFLENLGPDLLENVRALRPLRPSERA